MVVSMNKQASKHVVSSTPRAQRPLTLSPSVTDQSPFFEGRRRRVEGNMVQKRARLVCLWRASCPALPLASRHRTPNGDTGGGPNDRGQERAEGYDGFDIAATAHFAPRDSCGDNGAY